MCRGANRIESFQRLNSHPTPLLLSCRLNWAVSSLQRHGGLHFSAAWIFMSIHNFDDSQCARDLTFGEQSNGPCSLPCSSSEDSAAAHSSIGRAGHQSQTLPRDRWLLAAVTGKITCFPHSPVSVQPFRHRAESRASHRHSACASVLNSVQPRASKALCDSGFLAFEAPLLNSLPSRHMACRMMASLRATATQAAR